MQTAMTEDQLNLQVETDPINNDCETVLPGQPFQNIALTFSCGGFRATSFSLSVLSYLNHYYLTDASDKSVNHVKFITSTSGGHH
jgi:hypothetical protein